MLGHQVWVETLGISTVASGCGSRSTYYITSAAYLVEVLSAESFFVLACLALCAESERASVTSRTATKPCISFSLSPRRLFAARIAYPSAPCRSRSMPSINVYWTCPMCQKPTQGLGRGYTEQHSLLLRGPRYVHQVYPRSNHDSFRHARPVPQYRAATSFDSCRILRILAALQDRTNPSTGAPLHCDVVSS